MTVSALNHVSSLDLLIFLTGCSILEQPQQQKSRQQPGTHGSVVGQRLDASVRVKNLPVMSC